LFPGKIYQDASDQVLEYADYLKIFKKNQKYHLSFQNLVFPVLEEERIRLEALKEKL